MSLSKEDLEAIDDIVQRRVNGGLNDAEKEELIDDVRRMMNMRLEFPTLDEVIKASPGYDEGDEKCPFFSERFLYPLLGKDDARTVLGTLKRVIVSSGLLTSVELWKL